jgi:hypothetical protein
MPTTEQRFIDTVESRPNVTATALAQWLGVSRPYVYELAAKCGYARIEKTWTAKADQERQGDSLYRMVSELHETLVEGVQRGPKGQRVIEVEPGDTKPWSVIDIDGDPHFVVPIYPVTEKNRAEAYKQVAAATQAGGVIHKALNKEQNREVLSILAGLAAMRAAEIKD